MSGESRHGRAAYSANRDRLVQRVRPPTPGLHGRQIKGFLPSPSVQGGQVGLKVRAESPSRRYSAPR
jgi:hypothetical protein